MGVFNQIYGIEGGVDLLQNEIGITIGALIVSLVAYPVITWAGIKLAGRCLGRNTEYIPV